MNKESKAYLRTMLDAHINEDPETAKKAFHDYVVDKSKNVMEMHDDKQPVGDTKGDPKDAKGAKDVKDTMKRGKVISKKGESADEPKDAKGAKDVKDTMKRGKVISKKGESADEPKDAKGAKDVKKTMKKAADKNITAKKS